MENKLIGGASASDIENRLVLAIRRAASAGDEAGLIALAKQVQSLADTATTTRDSKLMDAVARLLKELKAAADGGPKTYRPVLEYKDCAYALSAPRPSFERENKFLSGAMKVEGYASTFGGPPDLVGDIIEPGAFAKSLAQHKAAGTQPKLFWSHDPSQVPGAWLDMREDSRGLVAQGKFANTTLGRDLNELVEMRAVDALSIGFSIPKGGARFDGDGIRRITAIDLFEVSLVSMPANPRALLRTASPVDSVSRSIADMRRLIDERAGNVVRFPNPKPTADSTDNEADVLASLEQLRRRISSPSLRG